MSRPIQLILASASPRRAELLKILGLPFRIFASHVNENEEANCSPEETVLRLAQRKARALESLSPSDRVLDADFVVAADTAIEFERQLLGKPEDESDAVSMLMSLSGKRHRVLTGVCVLEISSGRSAAGVVTSEVTMLDFGEEAARKYAAGGEPLDKAGSYAIQGRGAELIAGWSGCYNNIVGLPVCELARLIRHFRSSAPVDAASCRLPDRRLCPRLSEPTPRWVVRDAHLRERTSRA